jgi:hypothetical protein
MKFVPPKVDVFQITSVESGGRRNDVSMKQRAVAHGRDYLDSQSVPNLNYHSRISVRSKSSIDTC